MTKSAKSLILILLQIILWLLAVCAMIFIFHKKLSPLYSEETSNATHFITTPDLLSGDVLTQTFISTYDRLNTIDIAFSYEDDISQDTMVQIRILHGEEVIVKQDLSVRACPNNSFLSLRTDVSGCQGEIFTVHVENISPTPDHTAFALMATDKEYLYLANTSDYALNGIAEPARILCQFTYQTGYSYYPAATYVFWILLTTLILSGLLPRAFQLLPIHR